MDRFGGWGHPHMDNLGMGDLNSQLPPCKLLQVGCANFLQGKAIACILKNDGSVWGMGANGNGQLGLGGLNQTNVPVKLFDHGAKEIHAGRHHSLILTMDGTLWGAGQNSKGQLGLGDLTGRDTFTQIATGVMRLADVMSNEHTVPSANNMEMLWVEPGTFTMGSPLRKQVEDTMKLNTMLPLPKVFTWVSMKLPGSIRSGDDGEYRGLSATPSQWHNGTQPPGGKGSWDDAYRYF